MVYNFLINFFFRPLKNNGRVNHVDKNGQTALFHAAEHGQTSVVKYLLRVDADVLIRFVFLNVSVLYAVKSSLYK